MHLEFASQKQGASRGLHLMGGAVMLTVGETSRSTSANMRLKCVSSLVRIFCACGKERMSAQHAMATPAAKKHTHTRRSSANMGPE